jgi:hypothetical protein
MTKLFAALTIALFAQAAQADVAKVDFTTRYDWNNGSVTQIDPIASLTLTLNQDGTVAAQVDTAADQYWNGVGIDATWSGFADSAATQGDTTGWGTSLGSFQHGLVCWDGCMGSASWTISGVNGPITSVQQLFTGGGSSYDAFFYTGTQYYGMAAATSAVPEPTSIALIGLGLAGVGIARRRKHA